MFYVPKSFDAVLENTKTLGFVSPSEAFRVFLNQKSMPPERWDDVVAHETCHSDLLTSTAFGHAQQLVFRLHSLLSESNFCEVVGKKSQYFRDLTLSIGKKLNANSWFAHEGAAVSYGVISWQKTRNTEDSLKYYLNMHPIEYQKAYQSYGIAMQKIAFSGATSLRLLAIVPNAIGQYCLNSEILDYVFQTIEGTIDIEEFDRILSDDSPNIRLSCIPEIFDTELIENILNKYESLFRLKIKLKQYDTLEINDLVNECVLSAIDEKLPGKIAFFHSRDVLSKLKSLLRATEIGKKFAWYWHDVSSDVASRKDFTRYHFFDG
jgi:hypothetical protein